MAYKLSDIRKRKAERQELTASQPVSQSVTSAGRYTLEDIRARKAERQAQQQEEARQRQIRSDAINYAITRNRMNTALGGAPMIGSMRPDSTLAPVRAAQAQRQLQNDRVEQAAKFAGQTLQNPTTQQRQARNISQQQQDDWVAQAAQFANQRMQNADTSRPIPEPQPYRPNERPSFGQNVMANLLQGSGLTSLVEAAENTILKDDKDLPQNYISNILNQTAQRGQEDAPAVAAIGNIAGGVGALAGISAVTGGVGSALGVPGNLATRAAGSAVNFGLNRALRDAGALTGGRITGEKYGKSILRSGAGGAAGSIASGLVNTKLANYLYNNNLMTPFMEYVRQGTAASAFSLTDTGVTYALTDKAERPSNEELAKQIATDFAFVWIRSAIDASLTNSETKARLERMSNQVADDYATLLSYGDVNMSAAGVTPEMYQNQMKKILNYTAEIRRAVNSGYIPGGQEIVNQYNAQLDMIESNIMDRIGGTGGSTGASTPSGVPSLSGPSVNAPAPTETAVTAPTANVSASASSAPVEAPAMPEDVVALASEIENAISAGAEDAAPSTDTTVDTTVDTTASSTEDRLMQLAEEAAASEAAEEVDIRDQVIQEYENSDDFDEVNEMLLNEDIPTVSLENDRVPEENVPIPAENVQNVAESAQESEESADTLGVDFRASVYPEEAASVYKKYAEGIEDIVEYDQNMRSAYEAGLSGQSLAKSGLLDEDSEFVDFYMDNQDAVNEMFRAGFKEYSYEQERQEAAVQPNNNTASSISDIIERAKKGITQLVERVKAGNVKYAKPVTISEHISDRLASDIKTMLGVSVDGWKSDLTLSAVRHIEKRHGASGTADHSMATTQEYELIPEVENNYTSIVEGKTSHEYKNSDGTNARTIILSMETEDGTSYVVEAVPDNRKKTIHVVSAYKNNRAGSGDAQSLRRYVPDELPNSSEEVSYSATNNLPQSAKAVKSQLETRNNVIVDGLEYAVDQLGTKYIGRIRNASDDALGGSVTNARSNLYRGERKETRQEAIDDLIEVAQNNGFLEKGENNGVRRSDTAGGAGTGNGSSEGTVVPVGRATEAGGREGAGEEGNVPAGSVGSDGNAEPAVPGLQSGGNEGASEPQSGGTGVSGPDRRVAESGTGGEVQQEGSGNAVRETGEGNLEVDREQHSGGDLESALSPQAQESVEEGVPESAATTVSERPADTQAEVQSERAADIPPKGTNFIIPEEGLKLPNGEKARYKANIAAIKTLRTLMADERQATPEEQEVLSKYVGWGGLKNAFSETDAAWLKENKQLKELLTDEEYKAARGSVLNAHYTEVGVIRAIYNGLKGMGFKGGRILEPAAGVGHFAGAMPSDVNVQSLTMVELDTITGNIAKYLYPNADVRVQGFETANLPDNYMDLAISNVPFGNYAIFDKSYPNSVTSAIHNYFFAKSLDKVRPGGLVCFITSRFTMDARDSSVRKYISERADLVGAIRLPDTAFKGNAGTEVVTDILVLKKREPGTPYKGESFLNADYYHRDLNIWEQTNEYFQKHPEMVLGEAASTGTMYRSNSLTYTAKPGNLNKQIEKAFSTIKAKMDYPVRTSDADVMRRNRAEIRKASSKTKNGSYVKENGKLYKNDNGALVEADLKAKEAEIISAGIDMRDTARQLLNLQMNGGTQEEIDRLRKKLNVDYDAFVKKNGPLNNPANRRVISGDADSPFIFALENYNADTKAASKADIFTKNTVNPHTIVEHVDNMADGLAASINESGSVDIPLISRVTGKSEQQTTRELIDQKLVFKTKDGSLQSAQQYLSGNVRAKLKEARALAPMDPDFRKNIEELEKVVPKDIEPADISVKPGATWVPPSLYADFAAEMLGSSNSGWRKTIEVTYVPAAGVYKVSYGPNGRYVKGNSYDISEYGTQDKSFVQIFEAALNNKELKVYFPHGKDEKAVLNRKATIAVKEKKNQIIQKFQEWMWSNEDRVKTYAPLYNDMFNNSAVPNYDGSKLVIDGLSSKIQLREHQANAVQRIIMSGGNTLLAHGTGSGKTLEMAAAAMKLRQIGAIRKPMFVVPKNLLGQWGNEFYSYFPNAKILLPGENDFVPKNRKAFVNKITTGDWDAVILSYEQFYMIPMSPEAQKAFYQNQIDDIIAAQEAARQTEGKKGFTVSALEKKRKSLQTKLQKLDSGKRDVDNINFESLGVDSLFVDEAHNFKNLYYTTQLQGVSDLGNQNGSERAFDLYTKVRYLQGVNGGRGIVFGTATPVMNSVVEMYSMQRYLQGDLLEQKGINHFDAWVNEFGDVQEIQKMKSGGDGYETRTSLARYRNLGELQQMFRGFADVVTNPPGLADKLPKLRGGAPIVVECEPTDVQRAYLKELGERSERVRHSRDLKEDNILKIYSDGKKMSYTQRMIDSSLPYEEGGKILKCVDNVLKEYKASKSIKGTQLVFCDTGVIGSNAKDPLPLWQDIKNMLVAGGIPEKEIAFAQSGMTDKQKETMQKKMNDGDTRVLIGSTKTMGTGLNVQRRLYSMHEINAPDRPGDVEQNRGRIVRQGNMNKEVAIYTYITKETFDSRQWDNLKRKGAFIHQAMAGDVAGRTVDGDGDFSMSAAEISAIASGNPLIIEQNEVSTKIGQLEALESEHTKQVSAARRKLSELPRRIEQLQNAIANYEMDTAHEPDLSGDKFTLTVGNTTFTKRTSAGKAIIEEAKKHFRISEETQSFKVGTVGDFDLMVTNHNEGFLKGEGQYPFTINAESADGTIRSLTNAAALPSQRLEIARSDLDKNQKELVRYEGIAKQTFDRADELNQLRNREAEIMEILNPSNERGVDISEDDSVSESRDFESTEAPVEQGISSAKTSIKQVPALFKDKNVSWGKVNIDIGGGKFDLATDYLKEQGVTNLVFDPYNRSEAVNSDTLNYLRGGHKADTATCANVLNVIAEERARDNVILEMAKAIKPDGRAYFMVYEGDGSGIGRETSSGWQNNRKTATYVREIEKYFHHVVRNGKLITAMNPAENLPKASWEVTPGKAIRYSKDMGTPHPDQWTASRVGNADTEIKPLSDIINEIRHTYGINITTGHIRGAGVRGQYNEQNKGIRSKIANDLPTISHELGHHFDDIHGITTGNLPAAAKKELVDNLPDEFKQKYAKKDLPGEGMAEYIRRFLQNSETAAIDYPEFTKHFLGTISPKERVQLENFADEVNAYYSLDADTATSSIRLREDGGIDLRTPVEKMRDFGDSAYQQWFDSNYSIKQLGKSVGSNKAYVLATNAAYSDNMAGNILTGDLTDADGRYVGPGLKTALHGVNLRNGREYKLFNEYLVVRHAPERLARQKRVFADDRKNSTAWCNIRQAELEKQYQNFKGAADRLIQFEQNFNRVWGVGYGLIPEKVYDSWQEYYPNHVPLNRAMEKGRAAGARRSYANQRSPYKRSKGGGQDIIAPVDNIIDEVVRVVNTAVRNNVMLELRDTALQMGVNANFMEKVPEPLVPKTYDVSGVKGKIQQAVEQSVQGGTISPKGQQVIDDILDQINDTMLQFERGRAGGNIVTVLVDGQPEYWKINDPLLLQSVTTMSGKKLEGLVGAYAATTRFLTANITGNNPIWSIFSNLPRDFGTLLYYSPDKNVIGLVAKIGSGYLNSTKNHFNLSVDPLYAEYLAMGGGHTSMYSADINLAKKVRKEISGSRIGNILALLNPIESLRFLTDTIEQGPRFATYRYMREQGYSTQDAFYAAMDVTVNFRKAGYKSRQTNAVIPFFNAGLQGADKFARYFSADDVQGAGKKKAVVSRMAGFVISSAIIATLLYALNNRDKEKRKNYQQLSNYTKNSYYCIPIEGGKFFCIPKPRELAVLTSAMESALEKYEGGNEHAFDEFADTAANAFLPSVASDAVVMAVDMPNAIKEGEIAEVVGNFGKASIGSLGIVGIGANLWANMDYLGRPIVSQSLSGYLPKDQYTDKTSKMAKAIGQALNFSPQQIDYVGNNALGYIWKVPTALFPVGEENVDKTLGVKNSYIKDPQYSTDLVNWAYDYKDKADAKAKSAPDDSKKALEAKLADNMTSFYGRFIKVEKTDKSRDARQTVLDMIHEFRKAVDNGSRTSGEELVYNLVEQTGDVSILPATMQTYVQDSNKEKHDLTDAQYVEYQTRYNGNYWAYTEESLSDLTDASQDQQIKSVENAKKLAKQDAENYILGQLGIISGGSSSVSSKNQLRFQNEIDLAKQDDNKVSKRELRDIYDVMIDAGLVESEARDLFGTQIENKTYKAWVDSGGSIETYLDASIAKEEGNQDGVVSYLKRSRLTDDQKLDIWMNVCGYKESTFEKQMR